MNDPVRHKKLIKNQIKSSKLIYDNTFTNKKPRKKYFQILMLQDDPFEKYQLFVKFLISFLCLTGSFIQFVCFSMASAHMILK